MSHIVDVVTGGMAVLREIDNNLYVATFKGEARQILFSKEQAKKSMWDEFSVFTADGQYNGMLIRVCDELVPVEI